MTETVRQLSVDGFFLVFFGRGAQLDDICSQAAYLDLATGSILQVFADDLEGERNYGVTPDENQALRARVKTAPTQYLQIPGLNRGSHHEILRAFLESEWTQDEPTRTRAREAFQDSITDWIGSLGCDAEAVRLYSDFRDVRVEEQAKEFLAQHGIEPVWR